MLISKENNCFVIVVSMTQFHTVLNFITIMCCTDIRQNELLIEKEEKKSFCVFETMAIEFQLKQFLYKTQEIRHGVNCYERCKKSKSVDHNCPSLKILRAPCNKISMSNLNINKSNF